MVRVTEASSARNYGGTTSLTKTVPVIFRHYFMVSPTWKVGMRKHGLRYLFKSNVAPSLAGTELQLGNQTLGTCQKIAKISYMHTWNLYAAGPFVITRIEENCRAAYNNHYFPQLRRQVSQLQGCRCGFCGFHSA